MGVSIINEPFRIRGKNQRLQIIIQEGSDEANVNKLVEILIGDGFDFSLEADVMTPVEEAERAVAVGMGIIVKDNMPMIEELAKSAGAALACSRPASERLQVLPRDRFVGMSGVKFLGTLYIACGISGAAQHLRGISKAHTVVAINKNPKAPIFQNCDYGIVGDMNVIIPLLTAKLNSDLPKPDPNAKPVQMKPEEPLYKNTKATAKDRYVCPGCGYEYDPDKENQTAFASLPDTWTCPECGVPKKDMISAVTLG
jgi:rubredoxin